MITAQPGNFELIASTNRTVQELFQQGLMWCYGFHHERATLIFEQALQIEPDCVLAHWGIAHSIAPFYNRPWLWFTEVQQKQTITRGRSAIEHARATPAFADNPPENKALLQGMALRFQQQAPVAVKTYDEWQQQYAQAMTRVRSQFADNLDIAALTCEALMNCTPWQLWDTQSGQPAPQAHTTQITDLLEDGLERAAQAGIVHPGLLHLHIHAHEMSPSPETAAGSAAVIRKLDTPCAHLNHMATHIDIQTGHYALAIETNTRAIATDQAISVRSGEFYRISRLHNYHLKLFAAMMAACKQVAIETAEEMAGEVSIADLRQDDAYLATAIEGFHAHKQHALIRFGCWDEIVAAPAPPTDELYRLSQALHYYARSVAFAALGKTEESTTEAEHFTRAWQQIPDWHITNNNPTGETLRIANHMQRGERLYRQQQFSLAFDELRLAVSESDKLNYCEPWAWMHPPRHALGALLLEQGEVDEALDAYETDLGLNDKLPRSLQNRGNVWSLHGLHECFQRKGQLDSAAKLSESLSRATALADVTICASCCCRRA